MANWPASAGSDSAGSGSVASNRALAGTGAPPSVYRHDRPGDVGTAPGRRPDEPVRPRDPKKASYDHPSAAGAAARGLAWVVYLIVLAGAAAGLFVAWQGSRDAARGAALVGCALLAGAVARLVLPPRYAGPLCSRRKASDVLAFAVFGAGVLVVALTLP